MYSCVNYERGCRGRVNTNGGRCPDCQTLGLRRPSALATSSPRNFKRPVIDMSLLLPPADSSVSDAR